ncbi:MAG: hypothetical protein ACOX2M_05030 [Fastidiosipilaceae bacterium]|jgi:hypothetical protein
MVGKPVVNTINIERGCPTVSRAEQRLKMELATLRRGGAKYAKVIHGYGSSGAGGSIRRMCRARLRTMCENQLIKAICAGESFGPFTPEGRSIVSQAPLLRQDVDWSRSNPGITIVVLK